MNDNEEINATEVEILLRGITELIVQTVMDPVAAAEQVMSEPALHVVLAYENGDKENFVFHRQEDDCQHR